MHNIVGFFSISVPTLEILDALRSGIEPTNDREKYFEILDELIVYGKSVPVRYTPVADRFSVEFETTIVSNDIPNEGDFAQRFIVPKWAIEPLIVPMDSESERIRKTGWSKLDETRRTQLKAFLDDVVKTYGKGVFTVSAFGRMKKAVSDVTQDEDVCVVMTYWKTA